VCRKPLCEVTARHTLARRSAGASARRGTHDLARERRQRYGRAQNRSLRGRFDARCDARLPLRRKPLALWVRGGTSPPKHTVARPDAVHIGPRIASGQRLTLFLYGRERGAAFESLLSARDRLLTRKHGALVEAHRMRIEGKRAKAYRLYRVDQKDKIVSVVAEADTLGELANLYKRRQGLALQGVLNWKGPALGPRKIPSDHLPAPHFARGRQCV
jgi:hypothetical protein